MEISEQVVRLILEGWANPWFATSPTHHVAREKLIKHAAANLESKFNITIK